MRFSARRGAAAVVAVFVADDDRQCRHEQRLPIQLTAAVVAEAVVVANDAHGVRRRDGRLLMLLLAIRRGPRVGAFPLGRVGRLSSSAHQCAHSAGHGGRRPSAALGAQVVGNVAVPAQLCGRAEDAAVGALMRRQAIFASSDRWPSLSGELCRQLTAVVHHLLIIVFLFTVIISDHC